MYRALVLAGISAFLLFTPIIPASARKAAAPTIAEAPGHRVLPPGTATAAPPWYVALADTAILGEWTFDDGLGGPDPQGWITVDGTEQIGTFFHVDDFAGLGGGNFTPLQGTKSIWCGARPCAIPEVCSYVSLPGYGNGWDQRFESEAFLVTGNVTMTYLMRYDTEASYDFVYVQYQSSTGRWNTLKSYIGSGSLSDYITVPADSLAGSVKVRFLFQSDGFYSDEDGNFDTDGAAIIDMIEVADASGTIDYQDFESEAVGTTATVDGRWTAKVAPVYGNFAGLLNGSTVLQEDPLVTNNTHFWGFFNGSTVTYACGGHPEQMAVPFSRTLEGEPLYLDNEIHSPVIPLTGFTLESSVMLSFDVYRDLPLDNLVFYAWGVRSRVGGVWGHWRDREFVYWSAQKDWFNAALGVADLIDLNATDVQIRIRARDMCRYWCGVNGTGACHSHAPLVDNVRLVQTEGFPEFVVTNTNTTGAGSLRLAITQANTNGSGIIRFDIPGAGPHTINVLSGLTTGVRCVIDGTTQPGYAGTPLIRLTCSTAGATLLTLGGSNVVRGLEIDGSGVGLRGVDTGYLYSWIESCLIKNCVGAGIRADGYYLWIGGPDPGQGNRLIGNGVGIEVVSLARAVTIRGNSLYVNNGLGIDLGANGVTLNDAGDADTGPNDLINYPTIDYLAYGAPGWVGGYITGTAGEIYTVDFYGSTNCDALGYGEGDVYLGSTSVTALSGNQDTWFHAPLDNVPGSVVTATVTDSHGNTSEFSQCSTNYIMMFPVTHTGDYGTGSLRAALQQANSFGGRSMIRFQIPHTGNPLEIRIGYPPLPVITSQVIIDGYSQIFSSPNTNPPGAPFNGWVPIVLKSYPAPNGTGLFLAGGNSVVRGVALNNFHTGITLYSDDNVVEGCLIGLDPFGAPQGNFFAGVLVRGDRNRIGGVNPSQRNIVTGNGFGLLVGEGVAASHTRILGNWIGLDISGAPVGNANAGVILYGDDTEFGGPAPEAANTVAGSGEDGIAVYGTRNRISGNGIYANAWLGIDLYDPYAGVTQNDAGDVDTGPNGLLNFPVITSAVATPAEIQINGTYSGAAGLNLEIQFFVSAACDPSGHGEGQKYLGSKSVNTGTGTAAIAVTLPVGIAPGQWITATAIDLSGNTSEFAACVEVVNTPSGSGVLVKLDDGEAHADLTFENITAPGNTSLTTTGSCAELPGTFLAPDSLCYDISTTATFSGNVEVCFVYDEASLAGSEANVRLIHYDATLLPPAWVDITTSLDTGLNRVCGETSTLSPFVIGTGSVTAVGPVPIPERFALRQNIPNPFNPTTVIGYDVAVNGTPVTIRLYDVAGRLVQTLVDEPRPAGVHQVTWDGRNSRGEQVATGVYFCRMQAGSFVQTRKMVLLK